ncbi:rhamnan synthesis F family protein [Pseudomonas alliivorans]|nr:rhamnan synthesis F family protein [Pseudomonas alliivorans]MEE4702905.1 rhamnan synthesis F family protein [Pseudomonas alliivorans]MEE4738801.1 rhamnan synthesis F family protein [Pseudomonas alliivorans]
MNVLPADFSASDYLRLNPDIAAAGVDPNQHYLEFGQAEGRIYTVCSRDKEYLLSTGIFDPDFYLKHYPDVVGTGIDPIDHFLTIGCSEGRWASFFFRSDWYMECHPDSRNHVKNCLFHYLETGSGLGYEPNPFFEPSYYRGTYSDELGDLEPLTHFVKYGAEGFNPSPRFDAVAYIKETGCTGNPLKHYLEFGMQAGVPLRRAEPLKWGEQVESAFLRVFKLSDPAERVTLLITHSRDGSIKPHVEHYASHLSKSDTSIFLIVASEFGSVTVPESLYEMCSHIVVRQNIGYDFAAWAHVIKRFPWLGDCTEIILTNDSVIGPVNATGPVFIDAVRSRSADVIGLVENHEHADHVQSFFLLLRKNAICDQGVKEFWASVVNHADKSKVIRDYEVTFTSRLKALGLSVECVFPNTGKNNSTIFKWEALLDEGFPFLKYEVVRNAGFHDIQYIKAKLVDMSFDISLVPELNE